MANSKAETVNVTLVDYYVNGQLKFKLVTEGDYDNALANETMSNLLGEYDEGSAGTTEYSATTEQFARMSKMTSEQLDKAFN
jgi:hypothetical protein